jgi:hypothetical protein
MFVFHFHHSGMQNVSILVLDGVKFVLKLCKLVFAYTLDGVRVYFIHCSGLLRDVYIILLEGEILTYDCVNNYKRIPTV